MIHLTGIDRGPICGAKDYDIAVGLILFDAQPEEDKCKACMTWLTQEERSALQDDIQRRNALYGMVSNGQN